MAGHWTSRNFSFVTGSIRRNDLGYLILSDNAASDRKIPMAGVVQWDPSGWGDGGQVNWRVAGTTIVRSPLEQLCVVGEFGDVLFLGSGDRHQEKIGKGRRSPKNRGPIRGVRAIGDHIYAVGMDRQIYRREATGHWVDFDQGVHPQNDHSEVVGFESVDGYSELEMYAVGWDGEIWFFDGSNWRQLVSPCNTVLVDVCCAGDGFVYACARNGILLRGRYDIWDVLDIGEFSDDFWSLVWFDEKIYLATMDGIFSLRVPGVLEYVDMGVRDSVSCYDLAVGANRLWSIGAKDVMSFDGLGWSRID